MGNKLGRRKQVVDERYTRPQGLYVHKDVDHKKLRKLILESKLAPCYPGGEECGFDHEECPICFLYYPSLNRSRCCMKGICTECFLQMKNPNSTRPTQCPFCKTSNYAVEYRGLKTKEEKGLEQIEEQRVIEAKIRIQQQELQDEEERMQKRLELSSSSTNFSTREVECGSLTVPSYRSPVENEEIISSQYSIRHSPQPRMNRDGEFDLDLEDIMVMEAIWLSIQENGKRGNLINVAAPMPDQYSTEGRYALQTMAPLAGSSSSPSGGLACAIAALAERQQMGGESSAYTNGNMSTSHTLAERQQMGGESSAYSSGNMSTSSLHLGGSSFDNGLNGDAENYASIQRSGNMSPKCRVAVTRDDGDWTTDRVSDAAEAGSSYVGSDTTEEAGGVSALLPPPPIQDNFGDPFRNVPGPIVPESFEEQMMLAMAVSLAEARAMTAGPGSTWQ